MTEETPLGGCGVFLFEGKGKRTNMSIKVMSYVWEHCRQKGSKKLMMLAIADHADDYGVAFPGVPRLALKCEMTERNAQSILATLESDGEIMVDFGNGINTNHGPTNRYYLIQYRRTIGITGEEIITSRGEVGNTPGVKKSSPQRVKRASPKPSVEPSEETSVSIASGNAPQEPEPPKPKKTKQPSPHQQMFEAIFKVFGWDWNIATSTTKTMVGKVARELAEASAKPGHIPALYNFCANSFDDFSPMALAKNWSDFVREVMGGTVIDPQPQPEPAPEQPNEQQREYTNAELGLPEFEPVDVSGMSPEEIAALYETTLDSLDKSKGLPNDGYGNN